MRHSLPTADAAAPAKEGSNQCKLVTTTTSVHRAYITDAIGDPKDYLDLIELLRSAAPPSEIEVHVNSYGGYIYTMLQIVNAIRASRVPVTTVLDGIAYSAAGIIFLSGKKHRVESFATLMCHSFNGCVFGKMQEIKANADFDEKDFRNIAADAYKGFLSANEMKLMFHGEDLWFHRPEIVRRLGKKVRA